MKIHPREAALMLATAGAALLGATILLARPKLDEWSERRRQRQETLAQIEREQRLLATGDAWRNQFEELRQRMPVYPADKKMDVHWLSVMDELAAKHGVSITRRQVGEEKRVGDVYELPIEAREWEGSLEAMVRFLFDLQAQGAMLDVRQLFVRPKEQGKPDVLRGRFTLYCAYLREPGAAAPAAEPAAEKTTPKTQGSEE